MPTKKLIGAIAFSAALAGGGVAGALLGVPGTSSAQTAPAASTASTGAADAANADQPRPMGGGPSLDAAAKALGMTVDELHTALDGGQTIAQVAAAKSVDVQKVIDAMVADATTNITQRITDFVNNGKPAGGPGEHGGPGVGRPSLDVAASALGITVDELRTDIEGGQTIAQVAAAKSVDVQKVIDALVADATAKIDQAVTDGKLTADQAATAKADLNTRITGFVNNTKPAGGPHGGRGPGGPPPDAAPSSDSSSASSTSS